MPGVKFELDAGRSKHRTEETNRLLKTVSEIQLRFIRKCDVQSRLKQAFLVFLDVKNSQLDAVRNCWPEGDSSIARNTCRPFALGN